jgi:hypothetical protein
MKHILATAFLLLLAAAAHAQTAADAPGLTKLLNEFLAGASQNNAAVHERFWANDLIYTRPAGVRIGKAELMKSVRSAPAPKPDDPKVSYTANAIRIQQYGKTAIVAFELVATSEKDGRASVSKYLNTGTFLKRKGKWQAVAWQSTMVPKSKE